MKFTVAKTQECNIYTVHGVYELTSKWLLYSIKHSKPVRFDISLGSSREIKKNTM